MSVRTRVAVLAVLVHDDVSAHLGLLHFLNLLVELEALFPVAELLLHGAGGLSLRAVEVLALITTYVVVVRSHLFGQERNIVVMDT